MLRSVIRIVFCATVAAFCATAAAQEQQGRSVVRVSYIPGNFALPLFVGIEHGLFAREGLFLSTVPATEEGTIMRSLGQGGTDFAIGSQSLLLSIAQNKLPIKTVAIAGYNREMDLVVPVWDTTTKTFADVKGKSLLLLNGVHNFDAVPILYRALALSKPPMRLSDAKIEFIDLLNLSLVMDPRFKPQYTQRKVAGVFMYREYTAGYVDQKKARVVLSSEELGKLTGRIGAQPVLGSELTIKNEPKMVERFVRGWARTVQHMANPANKAAVVRILQIYYLRQYGFLLKKELAEGYIDSVKYDRLEWTENDLAELTINAKALSAGRNLLFANIKDPNQRPFKDVPDLAAFVDMSFAKKALSDLEAERKAAAAKPPETPKEAEPEKKPETPAAKPEEKPAETPSAKPDDKAPPAKN